MNWKDRKTIKQARELAGGTRKLLRMHRDVIEPRRAQETSESCEKLETAIRQKTVPAIASASQSLEQMIERTFPRVKHAGLRENVEVLLVAVIVAMAVRTFFIQPFKIPTGSMQPTLYGIYPPPEKTPLPYASSAPSLPVRLAGVILQGKIYLRDGYRARGDHIFVDKFSYHFRKPRRGEVIVFDTRNITALPDSHRGRFYIKRLIGLGEDVVTIAPPHVLVNGQILDERPAFRRIYSQTNGYDGYELPDLNTFYGTPPEFLNTRKPSYQVPAGELFVLGDNTHQSLDGRFLGSFPKTDLVGRAILVYWPFTRRFGPIE